MLNTNNEMSKSNSKLITIQTNQLFFMCVLFYSSYVCVYAYANVCFQTSIIKQNIKITLIAGVPSSQVLPGFLITAPPSACVPNAIGVQLCGFKKKKVPVVTPYLARYLCGFKPKNKKNVPYENNQPNRKKSGT